MSDASAVDTNDDLRHVAGTHPRWRESYYFSFFNRAARIGGFASIAERPGKGYVGSINGLWGPGRSTPLATEWERGSPGHRQNRVRGLEMTPQSPFGPWRISFRGWLNDGGSARECHPHALGSASVAAQAVAVGYDLTFTPRAAPYFGGGGDWKGLFEGHVGELGRFSGRMQIGHHSLDIDGYGAKDHSWGPRDWTAATRWRWVDVAFADGVDLVAWRAEQESTTFLDGFLMTESQTDALVRYSESVTYAPDRFDQGAPAAASSIDLDAAERRCVRVCICGDPAYRAALPWARSLERPHACSLRP